MEGRLSTRTRLRARPSQGLLSRSLGCATAVATRPCRLRFALVAGPRAHATPPTERSASNPSTSASAPAWSRRAALLSLPFAASVLNPGRGLADVLAPSRALRSLGWAVPCEMTVLNHLDRPLKIFWLNYDGDAELFGNLTPDSLLTLQTYESHAWRFVDGVSGSTVAEHVATSGSQVVRLAIGMVGEGTVASAPSSVVQTRPGEAAYTYTAAPAEPGRPRPVAKAGVEAVEGEGVPGAAEWDGEGVTAPGGRLRDAGAAYEGFDGLGNSRAAYCEAKLSEVTLYPGGGTLLLALPGGSVPPLEVSLTGPEALSLVAATGSVEGRRPSTLGTWGRSLLASGVELRRVCITRMVDGMLYTRIVLARPGAGTGAGGPGGLAAGSGGAGVVGAAEEGLASLDATPGDSLALALALGRPIYVSNEVARVHQSVWDVFVRRRAAMESAAQAGLLDEAAEAEADKAAQAALDSITATIPTAPRPVRRLEMDQRLDA